MKRIFVALKIEPGDIMLRMHASLVSMLGNEKITWVSPQNIHITLAFLGDTVEDRIKIAGIVLKQKCSGFGEFDFLLTGAGLFSNFRDPKVIWAGIEQSEQLSRLNGVIVKGLIDTGFKIEERPFQPHITLGRIKSLKEPESLRRALEKYKETRIQEVHADAVTLFESILEPTGPIYKPIGKFKLQ
jgi:2'-5' RNA ligase